MYNSIYGQFKSGYADKKLRDTSIDIVAYEHPIWVNSSLNFVDDDIFKAYSIEFILGQHIDETFKMSESFFSKIIDKLPLKMKLVELSKDYAVIRTSPDDDDFYYELSVKEKSAHLVKKLVNCRDPQLMVFTKDTVVSLLKAVIEPLSIKM